MARAFHAGASAAAREYREARAVAAPVAIEAPAAPLPPPAPAGSRLTAELLGRGLLPACVCFWLVVLDADLIVPTAWLPWYRLACAAVLIPVGGVLVVRQRRERRRLLAVPPDPSGARRTRHAVRRGWRLGLVRVLELLGWAILGAGAYELVLGGLHFL